MLQILLILIIYSKFAGLKNDIIIKLFPFFPLSCDFMTNDILMHVVFLIAFMFRPSNDVLETPDGTDRLSFDKP